LPGSTISVVWSLVGNTRKATFSACYSLLVSSSSCGGVFEMGSSKPEAKAKPALSKQVGDLYLVIKECARTGDPADTAAPDFPIRCVGSIENKGDVKIRVEFTNGSRVIDDAGNEYKLWETGPWGGSVPHFSIGTGCCAEELIPRLAVKFGFGIDHVKRGATLINPVLDLISSGNPPRSEVIFRGIPIRGH